MYNMWFLLLELLAVKTKHKTSADSYVGSGSWAMHIRFCSDPEPFTDRRRAHLHSCLSTRLQQISQYHHHVGSMNPESFLNVTGHTHLSLSCLCSSVRRFNHEQNMISKSEQSTRTDKEKADRGSVKLKVKWGIRQKDGEGQRERAAWMRSSFMSLTQAFPWLTRSPSPSARWNVSPTPIQPADQI